MNSFIDQEDSVIANKNFERDLVVCDFNLIGNDVVNQGLRFNDELIIRPICGYQKKIKLNRTKFNFIFSNNDNCNVRGSTIDLPTTMDQELNSDNIYDDINSMCEYSLILCYNKQHGKNNEESARYFFKSNKKKPFRINGISTYNAWPQHGDVISLEHNIIKFERATSYNQDPSSSDYLSKEKSEGIFDVFSIYKNQLSDKCIKSNLSVLLEGETGTGKSYLARRIHELSGRAGKFVHVNISSFSSTLIESELFGHKKGAFTGAIENKIGALLEANGGTLFLDEIDSLPLELQVKLLLFFDNKNVRAVGGNSERQVDMRLIVASGSSLMKLVEESKMRKDFYYRIASGAHVKLRPLRECSELIEYIVKTKEMKHDIIFSRQLLEFYLRQTWPGNIREFLGHIEKKIIFGNSRRIIYDDLDEGLICSDIQNEDSKQAIMMREKLYSLEEIKKKYIDRVYMNSNANLKLTAKILHISPATVKQYIDCIAS